MTSEGEVKKPQLILVNGEEGDFQKVIHLGKNNVKIGRAPDCDIVWESPLISRRHATLEFFGSRCYIRDTSSTGITLNGERVRKGKLINLSHSDVIGFFWNGSSSVVEYQFQCDQASSSSTMVLRSETRTVSPGPQASTSASMYTSQEKHKREDTSESDELAHVKKKKVLKIESSSEETPSLENCQSTSGSHQMSSESVKNDDVEALREELRTCMSKLAETELDLETLKSTKNDEVEALQKSLGHSESMNVALKEESLKKTQELMESELNCIFCTQVFIQATVIDCGHSFCSFCINHWSRTKKECPVCRKPFTNMASNVQTANFIAKTYESLTPELQALRATCIREREEEAKKAQEEEEEEAQNENQRPRRNYVEELVVLGEDGEFEYTIEVYHSGSEPDSEVELVDM